MELLSATSCQPILRADVRSDDCLPKQSRFFSAHFTVNKSDDKNTSHLFQYLVLKPEKKEEKKTLKHQAGAPQQQLSPGALNIDIKLQ